MVYEVDTLRTRFWSNTLPPRRLTNTLNERTSAGWTYIDTITAERRIFLIFGRHAYHLIFGREG
jgi:Domain of unknown function (DUF4177)